MIYRYLLYSVQSFYFFFDTQYDLHCLLLFFSTSGLCIICLLAAKLKALLQHTISILLQRGERNFEKWFARECRWASLEGTGTAPIPGIPLPPAASADGTCLNLYLELSGCSNFDAIGTGTFFWYRVRYVQTIIEHCVNLFYFRDLLSC